MKKLATVFIVAVLVPTLVLAWLAVRSMRDQEIVINSQRALLHQRAADALADDLNTFMDDVRFFFSQLVDDLVIEQGVEPLSQNFDQVIQNRWTQASFGCVVTDDGKFLSPDLSKAEAGEAANEFMVKNRLFLTNQSRALVYQAPAILNSQIVVTEDAFPIEAEQRSEMKLKKSAEVAASASVPVASIAASSSLKDKRLAAPKGSVAEENVALDPSSGSIGSAVQMQVRSKVEVAGNKLRSSQYKPPSSSSFYRKDAENKQARQQEEMELSDQADGLKEQALPNISVEQQLRPVARNVQPSLRGATVQFEKQDSDESRGREIYGDVSNWSSLERNSGNLKELMGDRDEGAISRFLQDGMHILLWKRHPSAPERVFWAELNLGAIRKDLKKVIDEVGGTNRDEASLALLDSDGDVVAQTVPGFRTDWKRPFAAAEVGEILPHWEVAAYLLDPGIVNRSAQTVRLTIWLMVPTLLAAIAIGSFLIFRAIGLEMNLARQKTDFVSNVSHELKTPLTSIRMFSDLLTGSDLRSQEKSQEYSGIISSEAARLTRLINNLLDFSRMDRDEMRYQKVPIEVVGLIRDTVENYRMQIESEGCSLRLDDQVGGEVMVNGDCDAISQVLLNLLSNAEKYGCSGGEIEVRISRWEEEGGVSIEVMDRGPGIDRKYSSKIFEKFYRVDDSLSSGIQGSGLGLTLARQIVDSHGGAIFYKNRSGGGSHFTIQLPGLEES